LGNPAEETFCRLDQKHEPSSNNTRLPKGIVTIWRTVSIQKFTKKDAVGTGGDAAGKAL